MGDAPASGPGVADGAAESGRERTQSGSTRASLRASLRNSVQVARYSHRMSLDMSLDLNMRSSNASMSFAIPRSPADRMAELKAQAHAQAQQKMQATGMLVPEAPEPPPRRGIHHYRLSSNRGRRSHRQSTTLAEDAERAKINTPRKKSTSPRFSLAPRPSSVSAGEPTGLKSLLQRARPQSAQAAGAPTCFDDVAWTMLQMRDAPAESTVPACRPLQGTAALAPYLSLAKPKDYEAHVPVRLRNVEHRYEQLEGRPSSATPFSRKPSICAGGGLASWCVFVTYLTHATHVTTHSHTRYTRYIRYLRELVRLRRLAC